jgi:NAD(P)-dependent dehydrogenase (short-subunit alcohol dehydrogenase family)
MSSSLKLECLLTLPAFAWTPITFLATNAGITGTEPALFHSICDASSSPPQKSTLQTLNVNLLGTLFSIQLFAHFFMSTNPGHSTKGSIVVTASEAGIYNLRLGPIYCATKYALVEFTRSLWPTLLLGGSTTNAILPGFVPTTITSPLLSITPSEYLTPLSTIVKAFTELMEGELTGQTVECSGAKLFYQKQQAYPNEVAR